jgi:putative phosphoesterase
MLLALISDIHANFEALSSVKDDLSDADLVLCLGDLIGYYCQVNEVIDYVRSLNGICVLGNHDHFLLQGCPADALPAVRFGIEYAESVITSQNRQWLSELPLVWGGTIGGLSLLLCHGSPFNPLHDYLYADSPILGRLDDFRYAIIAFGQTHRSLFRMDRRPLLLNPGSIGQSRDRKALACAVLLDTGTMEMKTIERRYDADAVIRIAMQHGAEGWVTKYID